MKTAEEVGLGLGVVDDDLDGCVRTVGERGGDGRNDVDDEERGDVMVDGCWMRRGKI